MVTLGVVLMLVGFALLRARAMWMELNTTQRILRVFGIALGAVGVFAAVFAATEAPPAKPGTGLVWLKSYDQARKQSVEQGKPVLVDFTATWCNACHELEAEVFSEKTIKPQLKRDFVLLKVDFDKQTPQNLALLKKFEVSGLPRIAFEGSDGSFLKGASFEGKLSPAQFKEKMTLAKQGAKTKQTSAFEQTLKDKGLLAALLLVFVAGIFSSLTPCVYPLIPITISLFGAREASSRWEGFLLSLTYVFGISITYSIMGVLAASVGALFGGVMQNPLVLVGLSVLFLVLGLSSVGLFDLRLPGNLQTTLSQKGGAGYLGALVMGLVAGIIAAPCVGPIVAGVLLYVAQQQDILLGWLLLMVFSFGMGLLFLVLGTFSSLLTRLPRSGGWMDGVKLVFGVVFFGMALYYLRYVVPALSKGLKAIWIAVGTLI